MTSTPVRKKRKSLYADPYLTVAEHTFVHEDEEYCYFIKEEPEFAVVGAVTEEGDIIMVRQFRPGPRRFLCDLPGGMVEEGDTPPETARKELLEETGYMGDVEYVTTCYPMAYTTAKKHIFIAKNCKKVAVPEEEANMIAEPVLLDRLEFAELVNTDNVLDLDAMLVLLQQLGLKFSPSSTP